MLVIGGGVTGLAIADRLAGEGLAVRLLESEQVGCAASGAAAGMLAPISEARADDPLLPLGLASLAAHVPWTERLGADTGIDVELVAGGSLVVLDEEAGGAGFAPPPDAELAAAARRVGWSGGNLREWLGEEALPEGLRPLAARGARIFRAGCERHLRPPLLVRALAASARARGARVESGLRVERLWREGDRVVGVETSAGRLAAGAVVVAAGPWTPGLLARSSIPPGSRGAFAIEPVRGQILELLPLAPELRSMLRACGVYLVPKRDGSCIVGATQERVGFDRRVTAGGVAWLLDRARAAWPSLEQAAFVRAWAGLRPVSADGLPWIGAWPGTPGLAVAAGHGRHGVLLAPLSAQLIGDVLLDRPDSDLAAGVRPG